MGGKAKRRDPIEPLLEPLLISTGDAPVPLALFDARRRLLCASPSWFQAFDADEAALGRPIDDILPNLTAEELALHARAAKGEHLLNEEEAHQDRDGAERWFNSEYRPIRDLDGRPIGYFVHGHDVTPLMHARREAQESATRLHLALEAGRAGVFETDFEKRTFWASPELVKIIGRTLTFEEASGPWPMIHPDDVDQLRAAARKSLDLRDPQTTEVRVVLPSGENRWIEARAEPHFDSEGRLRKIIGFVVDIDARKRQELALVEARSQAQANADRLALAMSAAKAGVCEFDWTSQEVWCSDEFAEILGRPLRYEDLEHGTWPMCHPDDVEAFNDLVARWTEPRHEPFDFRVILPSGEVRWVQIHSERQEDDTGRAVKTVSLLLDIHARKSQELALAEARREAQANAERLRLALGAAGAGVCEFDLKARRFWCSEEFEAIIGRTNLVFDDFGEDGVWPMCHPDDQTSFARAITQWSGSRHEPFEFRIVLPSGETRWVLSEGQREFDESGSVSRVVGLLLDIDARKRQELALLEARRELQRNAERLSLALSAAMAGVVEIDFVNRSAWSSPEASEILGRTLTFESFGPIPWPMCEPEDRPVLDKAIETWTEARHEPIEFRVRLPEGGSRWIQLHGQREFDADGQMAKIVGFVLDIDERKRQELALSDARRDLQDNAERLKLALDAARAGVFETNFKTRTFWCSPEYEEIVGRTLTFEEAMGVWPTTHPDDVPRLRAAIEDSGPDQPIAQMEWRIILPSGEERWIDGRVVMHVDENGVPEKLAGLVLDIDERKRQELALNDARRELQANAERLKLALDAAKAGAFESNFRTQTFWCSPEFVALVGRPLTFEESLGVWPTTHPDDAAHVQAGIDRAREGGPSLQLEWRNVLPSGESRWVDGRVILHTDENGVPEKLAGILLDVDARKRQELALVEAERAAQAAAEAKSQFLANMSHEIRTPMNGVLGVLHLLEKESLSEEGRALLDEASNCGRMLSQLLDDVIDFSRIEAGRLDLSPEPVNPAEIVRSVVGLLQTSASRKGVTLTATVEGEPPWINADPIRVRQGLFNLIGNAVKFTEEGRVDVRFSMRPEGERLRLRFEVEDTGVGIPAAVQATLFQRFQQADGSISRRFGGSGLGLAITRRLAELMDGQVGFVSREGEGSTFWFEILAEEAPAQSRRDVAPAASLDGLSILLVEDNPTNRLVASKMLEAMGAEVALAEDGRAGLEAVQAGAYDLVLMDVQMPVMDGLEATRRIRALDGPDAATPIIGLTANAMAHQRREYLAVGMNGVVAKPISPAMLLAEIARVLAESPASADTAAA